MTKINQSDVDIITQWVELYWNSNVDKAMQLVAWERICDDLTAKYNNTIDIEYLRNLIESIYKLKGQKTSWFINNLLIQLGIQVINGKEREVV